MPRPGSSGSTGKYKISGTRGDDVIFVDDTGVTVGTRFTRLTDAQIDAGIIINGSAGNDSITGGRGPDELNGGDGADRLTGGSGLDRLNGGAGDDWLVDLDILQIDTDLLDNIDPNANSGAIFDGGRGIDTIDFSNSPVAVGLNLDGTFFLGFSHTVADDHYDLDLGSQSIRGRITGVENLIGSDFADILWGNGAANEIRGGDGDDYLNGGGNSPNNDRLFGDAGNDVLYGTHGDDQLTGGAGSDLFMFASSGSDVPGHDVVHDYTPGEDIIVFEYTEVMPNWAPTTYNGIASLLGTYEDGASSVLLVGITDLSQVTMYQTTDINW